MKLGCPGETTTSMLTGAGSLCTYPRGSQLAAALAFIAAPFLAEYLTGAPGQAVAKQSVVLDVSLNKLLGAGYRAFGLRTADVQDAFRTTDFTGTAQLPGVGTVPVNVARVCDWTWMCAASPVGPNIHANATGYQVITCAFERAIGRLGRLSRRVRLPLSFARSS